MKSQYTLFHNVMWWIAFVVIVVIIIGNILKCGG